MTESLDLFVRSYEKFFGNEVMNFIHTSLQEDWIDSEGTKIHIDLFHAGESAPSVIFSHGMAGYGRLLAPYAYRLHKNGFNVILPDLIGYGLNTGLRGHWRWKNLVGNIMDAVSYAKERFNGDLFLAGGSMGGTIAYHGVCAGAPVKAAACYCLLDFQDSAMTREVSSYGMFTPVISKMLELTAKVLPRLSIPASWVTSYDNLSDNYDFNETVKADPLGGNTITLTSAAQMLNIRLPIPFASYDGVPILVIQPSEDKMTPARFTKQSFDALGTKNKKYVELPGRGHWVFDDTGVDIICDAMAQWFNQNRDYNR